MKKISCSHLNCSSYSLNKLCVYAHGLIAHVSGDILATWMFCYAIVIICVCHSDASFFNCGDEDIATICHLFWHSLGPFGMICKKEAFDQHHLLTSLFFTMFIFCLSTEFASSAWSNLFHTIHSFDTEVLFSQDVYFKHLLQYEECNKEFLFMKCAKFFISSISTWPKLVANILIRESEI